MRSNPLEVVMRFVERINAGDVDGIDAMMTDDHLFIDTGGDRYEGRERMREAWVHYYGIVPDYQIEVEQTVVAGDRVALFGTASGTYSPDGKLRTENAWSCPGAWLGLVENGKIAEWRIFADLEPLRKIADSRT